MLKALQLWLGHLYSEESFHSYLFMLLYHSLTIECVWRDFAAFTVVSRPRAWGPTRSFLHGEDSKRLGLSSDWVYGRLTSPHRRSYASAACLRHILKALRCSSSYNLTKTAVLHCSLKFPTNVFGKQLGSTQAVFQPSTKFWTFSSFSFCQLIWGENAVESSVVESCLKYTSAEISLLVKRTVPAA